MIKNITILLMLFSTLFIFVSCGKKAEPYISVTADEQKVVTQSGEEENPFAALIQNEIPYTPLGSSIQINFHAEVPEQIVTFDYVLNAQGAIKYSDREVIETVIDTKEDQSVSFTLKENFAAMLSSDSKDYEQGNSLRGFKVAFTAKNSNYEFYFIVRTDV